jgi:uncharacterized protein involved in exopolysaccharide biosynthesis
MMVPTSPQSSAAGLELRQILAIFAKWRWVMALVTIAAVGTAGFLSFFVLPKVYQAEAVLAVSPAVQAQPQAGGSGGGQGLQGVVQSVSTISPATMGTYVWQVTNPLVLQDTATALKTQGIDLSPGAIGAMVKASSDATTNLIHVDVSGPNPQVDAAVANALTQAYIQSLQSQDQQKLSQATDFLTKQVADVQSQLQQATADLAKAQAAAGTTTDEQARATADNQQLISLKGQLVTAQIALQSDQAGLGNVQQQLKSVPATLPASEADLVATASATAATPMGPQPNPLYQSLQQQLANDQVTIAQDQATIAQIQTQITAFGYDTTALAEAGGTQEMVSLQSQLVNTQVSLAATKAAVANLQQQLQGIPAMLPGTTPQAPPNPVYQDLVSKQSQLSVAVAQDQATVAQLQSSITGVQADLNTLPTVSPSDQANIQTLTQKVNQLTQTYQTLTAGLTQSQVAASVDGGNPVVTLAAPASTPTVPIKPNKKLNVALAFLVGLIASAGLALLLEQLDNTVKNPEDIRRLTELPTLAMIPHGGQ